MYILMSLFFYSSHVYLSLVPYVILFSLHLFWKTIVTKQNRKLLSLCSFSGFQALDLKPNYVRAWANMGISYANQVCFYACLFLHIFIFGLFFYVCPFKCISGIEMLRR